MDEMNYHQNQQPAHHPCRKAAWLCLELTVLALTVWAGFRVWREERKVELVEFTRKAEPLITALEAYRKEHEKYPDKLERLVPHYLPCVPNPMNVARSDWVYDGRGDECSDSLYVLFIDVRPHFCPFHLLSSSDEFVYHPNGYYNRNAFSNEGEMERIGEWAYYHE